MYPEDFSSYNAFFDYAVLQGKSAYICGMDVPTIKTELKKNHVSFPSKARKAELYKLLKDTIGNKVYQIGKLGVFAISYEKKFSLSSKDIEKMERTGIITVIGKAPGQTRWGRVEYKLYDAREFFKMTEDKIVQWRQENTRKGRKNYRNTVRAMLEEYSPKNSLEKAIGQARHFTIHCGPTNSGKTYQALQVLKQAKTGVYLGPLRLLALEVAETLNSDGCFCSMLTGEEYIETPGARHIASTIETCSFGTMYEVAVIDECQMLADPKRGHHWFNAITKVCAFEVILCTAPEALPILEKLMHEMKAEYTIIMHERLCPLEWTGQINSLNEIEDGDCIIAFSRKTVLDVAGRLETQGIPASVIYGALPPAARREQVRRFNTGETTVMVSTDAIGMGVSLPIRRIVFLQTSKYDGQTHRTLNATEILQIAGRAGRYGKYPVGYVSAFENGDIIKNALNSTPNQIKSIRFGFPVEILACKKKYKLSTLMNVWQKLPSHDWFTRADLSDAIRLYDSISAWTKPPYAGLSQEEIFGYISCSVDTSETDLIWYWRHCLRCILAGKLCPAPVFGTSTLEKCELQYKALDIRHEMSKKAGRFIDDSSQKEQICKKIAEHIKNGNVKRIRKCKRCEKTLPINHRYALCNSCYKSKFDDNYFDDLLDDLFDYLN